MSSPTFLSQIQTMHSNQRTVRPTLVWIIPSRVEHSVQELLQNQPGKSTQGLGHVLVLRGQLNRQARTKLRVTSTHPSHAHLGLRTAPALQTPAGLNTSEAGGHGTSPAQGPCPQSSPEPLRQRTGGPRTVGPRTAGPPQQAKPVSGAPRNRVSVPGWQTGAILGP